MGRLPEKFGGGDVVVTSVEKFGVGFLLRRWLMAGADELVKFE